MTSHFANAPLSSVQLSRIDDLCNRFEAAYQEGATPAVEEYLTEVEKPLRLALLKELVQIDSHYTWHRNKRVATLGNLVPLPTFTAWVRFFMRCYRVSLPFEERAF